MEQIETQQAYERIRAHFAPESARLGRTAGGSCFYRSKDGRKCAVGCLIDDEIFDRPPVYSYRPLAEVNEDDTGTPWETLADEMNACGSLIALQQYIFPVVPELKALLNGEDAEGNRKYQFLMSAQGAHDTAENTSEFVTRLDVIADEYGLTVVD